MRDGRSNLPTLRRARRGFVLADAIVGGVILALGLSSIFSIASRSMNMQIDGEKRMVASWLADELLSMVLVEGPDAYPRLHDVNGEFLEPFEEYTYEVDIDFIGRGSPYRVTAFVRWGDRDNEVIQVETMIALRLGDPYQPREPFEPVDRDARYYDDEF